MNRNFTRRRAIQSISSSFGSLALAAMAGQTRAEQINNPLAARKTHFPATAKHVIVLSMDGAPSHVDTFDYKPSLQKNNGKTGASDRGSKLMASQWKFNQHGDSGHWISSLFPNLSRQADELCMLKGMHCDQPSHRQATQAAHTGSAQFIRPSLGAWSVYGLGTENSDLPGFVALGKGTGVNFGSAFLPAAYQATPVNTNVVGGAGSGARGRRGQSSSAESVANIRNSILDAQAQRTQLDLLKQLNNAKLKRDVHQPQVEGITQSFELAYRMQTSMPQLMDLSGESQRTKAMYGVGEPATDSFGTQCLVARRMVEAGVRFVELSQGSWDHHSGLKEGMETQCQLIDKPIAGLLADLKQRDMLKDTLIVWGGEFGRTPHVTNGTGRGHNNKGYTTWMAGGGVKGGFSYGATDEFGYEAIDGRMHTHDWHATILHLLGLDHEKLTYRHAGRDFRLTDIGGKVATDILS